MPENKQHDLSRFGWSRDDVTIHPLPVGPTEDHQMDSNGTHVLVGTPAELDRKLANLRAQTQKVVDNG